jgi:hypothetical protein
MRVTAGVLLTVGVVVKVLRQLRVRAGRADFQQ